MSTIVPFVSDAYATSTITVGSLGDASQVKGYMATWAISKWSLPWAAAERSPRWAHLSPSLLRRSSFQLHKGEMDRVPVVHCTTALA